MNRTVRRFSTGYYLVNADTVAYNGEDVRIPYQMADNLHDYVTKPLFKIGNEYIWPREARDIPAQTVAVPTESGIPADDEVLLAKDRTTAALMRRDQVLPPE